MLVLIEVLCFKDFIAFFFQAHSYCQHIIWIVVNYQNFRHCLSSSPKLGRRMFVSWYFPTLFSAILHPDQAPMGDWFVNSKPIG